MKRYYYTDPLAAAWMFARHNMKFTTTHNGLGCKGLHPVDTINDILNSSRNAKFYIHADDLHLLDPHDGDLFVGNRDALYRADKGYDDFVSRRLIDAHNRYFPSAWGDERKIIQRNGIAFIWPEVEEVGDAK